MITHRTPRTAHEANAAALIALLCLAAAPARSQEAAEPAPIGVPVHEMLEDPFNRGIRVDEFEGRDADGEIPLHWDMNFWAGRSLERLTIRTEGERENGSTEHAELQLLWTRSFTRWWDVVAGARADFAPGSDKNWAAFGVQGLAPHRFGVEATAFISNGGDAAARVEAEYELLITNKLILQPQIELNWYGQTDVERGYSAGLSSGEAALRLRYEIRREIAPYVGIVREQRWGDSADAAQAAGFDTDDTSLVAGIRLRF